MATGRAGRPDLDGKPVELADRVWMEGRSSWPTGSRGHSLGPGRPHIHAGFDLLDSLPGAAFAVPDGHRVDHRPCSDDPDKSIWGRCAAGPAKSLCSPLSGDPSQTDQFMVVFVAVRV
jgi:hypothetical protein